MNDRYDNRAIAALIGKTTGIYVNKRARADVEDPINLRGITFCAIATVFCIIIIYVSVFPPTQWQTNYIVATFAVIGMFAFPYFGYKSMTQSLVAETLQQK